MNTTHPWRHPWSDRDWLRSLKVTPIEPEAKPELVKLVADPQGVKFFRMLLVSLAVCSLFSWLVVGCCLALLRNASHQSTQSVPTGSRSSISSPAAK